MSTECYGSIGEATGLDYFGARYFSGAQGRFTSPDPLLNSGRPWEPQSWNRYSYVLNNPLRYIDPLGLYECDLPPEISTSDNLESPVMERGFSDEEDEAQRRADDRCRQAA